MTRAAPLVLLVAATAGCTRAPLSTLSTTYSIVGAWAYQDRLGHDYSYDVADCGTDFGARYKHDGTYIGYDEEGRWLVEGDLLTEIVERETAENGEMAPVAPKRRIVRLHWLSKNTVNTEIDGEISGMIRCPAIR